MWIGQHAPIQLGFSIVGSSLSFSSIWLLWRSFLVFFFGEMLLPSVSSLPRTGCLTSFFPALGRLFFTGSR